MLEYRHLPDTPLFVSPIGFGGATLGREVDEDTSFSLLDYALENRINLIDTAESYGGGQSYSYRLKHYGTTDQREVSTDLSSSERIIGKWLRARGCRSEIVLTTKVSTGAGATNIRKALNASLERLQTDWVDIYEIHSPDPQVPIAESLAALTEEVDAAKVRVIGCSNFGLTQLTKSLAVSRTKGYCSFQVIQPPYNLIDKDGQYGLFPFCTENQIAITAYGPLAGGFLSGKYESPRSAIAKTSRFGIMPIYLEQYFREANFLIIEKLRAKADQLNVPMARLAMAWVMANSDITAVLIGARAKAHIKNALDAFEMRLDDSLWNEMASWP
jgi:aryl-alcohol dehydrogenase-like predicted oxidoreductase